MRSSRDLRRGLACGWLALLPMACAVTGALMDERAHLGYTNWLSACRAAGFTLSSTLAFTFALLPSAVIGLLLGGLAVQATGVLLRHRGGAQLCLAAHGGCALGMAGGLLLCTLLLPLPYMLGAEALLAVLGAALLLRHTGRRPPAASVLPPTGSLTSAQ